MRRFSGWSSARRRCYTRLPQQTATSAAYGFTAAPPPVVLEVEVVDAVARPHVADHRARGHASQRAVAREMGVERPVAVAVLDTTPSPPMLPAGEAIPGATATTGVP